MLAKIFERKQFGPINTCHKWGGSRRTITRYDKLNVVEISSRERVCSGNNGGTYSAFQIGVFSFTEFARRLFFTCSIFTALCMQKHTLTLMHTCIQILWREMLEIIYLLNGQK